MTSPEDTSVDVEALRRIQRQRSTAVEVPSRDDQGYCPKKGDVFLSLDIQYDGDEAHVAGDLHRWQVGHLRTYACVTPAAFPYLPGYFCFREGPPLLAMVERVQEELDAPLAAIIVDGHGLAHPRMFGVACWLGVATGLPTIGSAKRALVHFDGFPEAPQGSTREVFVDGRLVGHVLRTQTNIKPIYVSPGHRVTTAQALACVRGLPGPYRIPDPFRNADHAARAHCRGDEPDRWIDLGVVPESAHCMAREALSVRSSPEQPRDLTE